MLMARVMESRLWAKIAVLGIALSLLMSPLVMAQAATNDPSPLNLTISPLSLSLTAKPGQTVSGDIRVKNNSVKPETLSVTLLKFGASGENGNPSLQERGPRDTYFDWVSFSQPKFTAEPGVWKTIKMTIKPPASAAFGYYYAVLFSRASQVKPTAGLSSGVQGGVASLILFEVDAPGTKRQAEILEVSASRKVYEFLPADIQVKIRNTGNVHVSPFGSVFIKRGDTAVETIVFNPQNGNILPNTNRVFSVTWNHGFPAYQEKTAGAVTTRKLQWDFGNIQQLRIGRYSAHVMAVYDDGQKDVPIEATVSFWVIPWRILAGLLLVLLLLLTALWIIVRAVWKKLRRSRSGGPRNRRQREERPIYRPPAPIPDDLVQRPEPVGAASATPYAARSPLTRPGSMPLTPKPTTAAGSPVSSALPPTAPELRSRPLSPVRPRISPPPRPRTRPPRRVQF